MCVLAPWPDGWGYCDVLPTAAHLQYACRLQTPTTSRHALLDSALLPRFNSSGVVQFVVASRSVCPGDFGSGRFAPAGMLLPGGGSRLILWIMTPCTLTRSLSGGLFGILEPVRRFAAHLPRGFHAASNLPRWLSQRSSVWGGSLRTFVLLPHVWRWRILSS